MWTLAQQQGFTIQNHNLDAAGENWDDEKGFKPPLWSANRLHYSKNMVWFSAYPEKSLQAFRRAAAENVWLLASAD